MVDNDGHAYLLYVNSLLRLSIEYNLTPPIVLNIQLHARNDVQLTEHFPPLELESLALKLKLSSFEVTSPNKDDTILLSIMSSMVP